MSIIGIATTVFVVVLYAVFLWPVRYELGELTIRYGVIRSRIPYTKIVSVRPSRSSMGAPALSLKRLALEHGAKLPTLISPHDRTGFLSGLASKAPRQQARGDEVYEAV